MHAAKRRYSTKIKSAKTFLKALPRKFIPSKYTRYTVLVTIATRYIQPRVYDRDLERVSNEGILYVRCMWRVTWLPVSVTSYTDQSKRGWCNLLSSKPTFDTLFSDTTLWMFLYMYYTSHQKTRSYNTLCSYLSDMIDNVPGHCIPQRRNWETENNK